MKLKTLKDIEIKATVSGLTRTPESDLKLERYFNRGGEQFPNDFVNVYELKQEAIKWIKEISKDGFRQTPQITMDITASTEQITKALMTQETDLVVQWIKHFFNIKDKELE